MARRPRYRDRQPRADFPLDYPARLPGDLDVFRAELPPDRGVERFYDDQYEDSIRTGLSDSRYPSPASLGGSRASPWAAVRAVARMEYRSKDIYQRAFACARRSVRREVLFATRRTGKGAGAKRRQRFEDSKRRC